MAVLVQRGKLVAFFILNRQKIREYTGLDNTKPNRKLVADKLDKVRALIKAGVFDADMYKAYFPNSPRLKKVFPDSIDQVTDLTVAQYLDRWHAQRTPFLPDGSIKEDHFLHVQTWIHQGGTVELFKRAFGFVKLTDLSALHIRQLRAELELTRKPTTAVKILHVLSGALTQAFKDKLIADNPMPELKRIQSKRVPRRELTAEDREAFLKALPERLDLRSGAYITNSTLTDLYSFWVLTGWRDGEICGLKFRDVDHRLQQINVQRGRYARRNPITEIEGFEDRPKAGQRACPMNWAPNLLQMIKRRETSAEYLAAGRPSYVFHDSRGGAISQEVLARRIWAPIMHDLGISTPETVSERSTAMYSIRHSAICSMVDAGVKVQAISAIVGTSKRMIVEHYLEVKRTIDANEGRKYLDLMTQKGSAEGSASEPDAAEAGSK